MSTHPSSPAPDPSPLDVLAVGAHPDDVEMGCGGSLARLAEQGYHVGIIDLTDGEPTPLSPGPEARRAEAEKAAGILGACCRVTLDLPNRRLFDGFEARIALAKEFRRLRPRLVLGIGHQTPMASPDHYQAMLITDAAVFYSRLSKWEEYFEGLAPHHVTAHLYFFLGYRALAPSGSTIVFDITSTLEKKLAAMAAYETQFAHRLELLDRVRTFNQQQGMAAGFGAGEVFGHPNTFGTRDLMGLLFGPGGM